MKIFLSHITEEAAVAITLKEWIERSFAGQCSVFVSSDRSDLPAGMRWMNELESVLNDACVFLVLCSPTSLSRPWVNFETGCGWIKRVPIIPICHAGIMKGTLPRPISEFQDLQLDDNNFVRDLLSALAKHLGFSKVPPIDQAAMKSALREAARTIGTGTTLTVTSSFPTQDTDDNISQECLDILCFLSHEPLDPDEQSTASDLAGDLGITESRTQYFLDVLLEKQLIQRSVFVGAPPIYSLSPKGRKFLSERGLLK